MHVSLAGTLEGSQIRNSVSKSPHTYTHSHLKQIRVVLFLSFPVFWHNAESYVFLYIFKDKNGFRTFISSLILRQSQELILGQCSKQIFMNFKWHYIHTKVPF